MHKFHENVPVIEIFQRPELLEALCLIKDWGVVQNEFIEKVQ